MLLELLGVALATALFYVWRYMNNINKYWEERGIPYKKPLPFLGNNWKLITGQQSQIEVHRSLYKLFPDAKLYGFFDFMKPYLMVRDVGLVERVLIKDFHHFTDHGFGDIDEKANPTDVSLFNMNGKKWKAMRNKFSPMFTTGKLKHMVPQIRDISGALVTTLEKKESDVHFRDMFQRFSMDVIASCAFGITINALGEDDDIESEFRKMGKLAFKFTKLQMVRFFLHTCFPKVAKALKVPQNQPAVAKYFTKVIRETLAHRRSSNMTRNDFVQLMLTLQQKGSIEFEGDENDDYLKMGMEEKAEKHMETLEMTDDVMVGQAFLFLVAGFEAAASALMWLFYEFALNPETQIKARENVNEVMKARRSDVLDYDALKQMGYFNQCIQEAMRIHTFVPVLFRVCTKDYTFPGTSISIKAGQGLLIPVSGMHEDPELYPDPEKFIPERFAPDVQRPNCSYLPFGDGPRICIAMRFALTEVKLCAAKILQEYHVELSPKTKLPIEMDPMNFTGMPKYPIYFNLTKTHKGEKTL